MQTEVFEVNSSNLTRPLNQSVQQSNGAQFALMLSLLYESKIEQAGQLNQVSPAGGIVPAGKQLLEHGDAPKFNLETSQTQALKNNQQAHFHLMHSLYAERSTPADLLSANRAVMADDVLAEINESQDNAMDSAPVRQEAERVSFAKAAEAA